MKEIRVVVAKENKSKFLHQIGKINEKFTKYNYPLLGYELIKEEIAPSVETGILITKLTYVVYSEFEKSNLIGETVNFEGVVDLMEKGNEDTRLVKTNNPVINRIMTSEHCVCDKCKKNIARGKYFVFSKDVESVKTRDDFYILGSTCAKAYFPFNIQNYLGGLDNVMDDLMEYDEDSLGGYSIGTNFTNIETIALATNLATNGCTSIYSKLSTLDRIENVYGLLTAKMSESVKKELDGIKKSLTVEFDVHKSIENARKHFAESDTTNDFNFNCNQVLKSDKINKKHIRLVATAIYFGNVNYRKHEENCKSEYVGSIGDKFTDWKLTFDSMFSMNTRYGFTNVLKFKDENGNTLVWYTTKSVQLSNGDKVTVGGTIKGFNEYKGEKQTLITRCKIA